MKRILCAVILAVAIWSVSPVAAQTCNPLVPGMSIFIGYNQSVSNCTQIGGSCTAGFPISFLTGTYNYSLSCGTHTFSWNFGDGTTSTAQNPTHTYGNGTYTVTLVVTPPSGIPVTATATVTVSSGSCNPIIPGTSIFIGYNQATSSCTQIGGSCNAGAPINFTAATYNYSFSCGTHTFFWNFGDGSTSTAQNPAHTYANNGTYTVALNVGTSSAGNVQSTASVVVGSGGPSGCGTMMPGSNVFISYHDANSNCSQLGGSCPATAPISFAVGTSGYTFSCAAHTFLWFFGDGGTFVGPNPTHSYATSGTYPVTVTISNASQSVTLGQNVVVAQPCNALQISPSAFPSGFVGRGYTETLTATGGTAPYTFSLLSGVLPTGLSVVQNAIIGMPAAPGVFAFTIRATDATGCSAVMPYTIAITNPSCPEMVPGTNVLLNFSGSQSGCDDSHRIPCSTSEAIAFTVSPRNYDLFCSQHAFIWSFGDGQVAMGDHVTHIYAQPGRYDIMLSISNSRQVVQLSTTAAVVAPKRRASRH